MVEGHLRIIGDGEAQPDGPIPEGLADADLLTLYRWLVLMRTFETVYAGGEAQIPRD